MKLVLALLFLIQVPVLAQGNREPKVTDGTIPAFALERSPIELHRLAQANLPFDKVGRKFAVLGLESGAFEAWAYPLKLLRNFRCSFFLENSTRPLESADLARSVSVSPEATIITYVHQSFTARAIYITALDEPGAIILIEISAVAPLKIVCSFLPVLQPMWPAGIGGQYSYWDENRKAYIIGEPTGQNHGMVGSPAATGISYTPAHMLSDQPYEFPIDIKDPALVRDRYIPIYLAGGKGRGDSTLAVYKRLSSDPEHYFKESLEHFRNLTNTTLRIHTPVPEIGLAFEWAKVAYDNLVVENPDLGEGLVAGLGMSGTSGRPGFGWFFGGDAFINSFSIDSYNGYQTVRDALAFTQKWQRKDGKMAHELSQAAGYVDWFGKYHYGYIHGDTTPFYLTAIYDYYVMTADSQFIRDSWESLTKAYAWCRTTDANNDGLMDNRKAGLGALEFGALTDIESDVYMAAVWVRAAYAMQFLAQAVSDTALASQATADFLRARESFQKKFWDSQNRFYTYAFNTKNELVKETVPWSVVGLSWGIGDSANSVSTLERLASADMTTDWGVRTISQKSSYYDPLNYNYGTVWPFVNSWVATAMFKHHLAQQGYDLILASVKHTFDHQLGAVAEVFSGNNNIPLGEAVAHQGFSSAGVVLPLVRGLFGLDANAIEKKVTFAPQFPADWDSAGIENYRAGNATFSFNYRRLQNKLTIRARAENANGYALLIQPALGIGNVVRSVLVDGKPVPFTVTTFKQVVRPTIAVPAGKDAATIDVVFEPSVEILPPPRESAPGDADAGLKIISTSMTGKNLQIVVEGVASKEYLVEVVQPEGIGNVQGASVEGNRLRVKFPAGKPNEFIRKNVTVTIR